ncbi:hypothetical protein IG631_20136 [Alternaria alternata]|nr:hypothetical protein IG631_20136 [Alternaria alternata]
MRIHRKWPGYGSRGIGRRWTGRTGCQRHRSCSATSACCRQWQASRCRRLRSRLCRWHQLGVGRRTGIAGLRQWSRCGRIDRAGCRPRGCRGGRHLMPGGATSVCCALAACKEGNVPLERFRAYSGRGSRVCQFGRAFRR